jgi:hypothetical protein
MTTHELAGELLVLPDAPVELVVCGHSYSTKTDALSCGPLWVVQRDVRGVAHVSLGPRMDLEEDARR